MKKIKLKYVLTVLVVILVSTSAFSQKKYFKSALKKGKTTSGFYYVSIPSNKIYSQDKILEYGTKEGYILTNFSFKEALRFGEFVSSVSSFSFIPIAEAKEYIFNSIIKKTNYHKNIKYSSLIQKETGEGLIYDPKENEGKLVKNIHWTGSISNGKITGKGVGLYSEDNKMIVFEVLEGEYNLGVLNGTSKYYNSNYLLNHTIKNVKVEISTIYMQPTDNKDFITIKTGKYNHYGFINSLGKIVVPCKYISIVSTFKNGKAIVVNKVGDEIIIDTTGKFIDYSPKQKKIFYKEARIARNKELAQRKLTFNSTYENKSTLYDKDSVKITGHYSPGRVWVYDKNGGFNPSDSPPYFTFNVDVAYRSTYPGGKFEIYNSKNELITLGESQKQNGIFELNLTKRYFKGNDKYLHLHYTNKEKGIKHIVDSIYCPNINEMINNHEIEKVRNYKRTERLIEERKNGFRNIREGDILVFSATWSYSVSEGWFIFRSTREVEFENLTYLVVDKVTDDRIKVIANRTESKDNDKYPTNKYNGLKLYSGAIIYLTKEKLILDTRFKLYEP